MILLKTRNNQINLISPAKISDFKYAIVYSNILPYLTADQIVNHNIFKKVHDPSFLRIREKETSSDKDEIK